MCFLLPQALNSNAVLHYSFITLLALHSFISPFVVQSPTVVVLCLVYCYFEYFTICGNRTFNWRSCQIVSCTFPISSGIHWIATWLCWSAILGAIRYAILEFLMYASTHDSLILLLLLWWCVYKKSRDVTAKSHKKSVLHRRSTLSNLDEMSISNSDMCSFSRCLSVWAIHHFVFVKWWLDTTH